MNQFFEATGPIPPSVLPSPIIGPRALPAPSATPHRPSAPTILQAAPSLPLGRPSPTSNNTPSPPPKHPPGSNPQIPPRPRTASTLPTKPPPATNTGSGSPDPTLRIAALAKLPAGAVAPVGSGRGNTRFPPNALRPAPYPAHLNSRVSPGYPATRLPSAANALARLLAVLTSAPPPGTVWANRQASGQPFPARP